jgi:hypothetical protein
MDKVHHDSAPPPAVYLLPSYPRKGLLLFAQNTAIRTKYCYSHKILLFTHIRAVIAVTHYAPLANSHTIGKTESTAATLATILPLLALANAQLNYVQNLQCSKIRHACRHKVQAECAPPTTLELQ